MEQGFALLLTKLLTLTYTLIILVSLGLLMVELWLETRVGKCTANWSLYNFQMHTLKFCIPHWPLYVFLADKNLLL
jgi:hypothetical protein